MFIWSCINEPCSHEDPDPNLCAGVHEWRDGKRFVKEGDKLYLEGTNTPAGRCINFSFTLLQLRL